jgi:glycine oxidase
MRDVDYLIAGQGLAGTVLAWTATARGRSVLIADPAPHSNASRAAAGLINPILGPRLTASWRYHEFWPHARQFYRSLEATLHTPLLHETGLVRFLIDDAQRLAWQKKRSLPLYDGLWTPCPDHPEWAFLCPSAAWLDLAAFVEASAPLLPCCPERIDPAELEPAPAGIRWRDLCARFVIFCDGHAISTNPLFQFVPARLARGDILTLHLPHWSESRILHRGKWVLPIGNHRFRVGATYDWALPPVAPPPETAAAEILPALRPLLPEHLPPPERHTSGIRAMVHHGIPVLGRHPLHPRIALFNGLGAKGVLLAPWFAQQLLDHLEAGTPLDPAVDLRQFWKP